MLKNGANGSGVKANFDLLYLLKSCTVKVTNTKGERNGGFC